MDRSTELAGSQHRAWLLGALEVISPPYKEDAVPSQDLAPRTVETSQAPDMGVSRLQL